MFDFLYRYTCIFCGHLTKRNLDLCWDCEAVLPFVTNYCSGCGKLLSGGQKLCGQCLNRRELNITTTILFHYDCPIDKLILDLKFQGCLPAAQLLGAIMANFLLKQYAPHKVKPEVIIPMPLHTERLRSRGYNQSLELAYPIAKKLNLPIDKFSLIREKKTLPQAQLAAKKRLDNIKNAFRVKRGFKYEHVAIVDDVITTGSTVFELSKRLKKTGIKKIDIWCIAKS